MTELYGVAEYNKRNKFDWELLAEKCRYFVPSPEKGTNECGFYVLRMACLFDGEKFVIPFKRKDVCFYFSSMICTLVYIFMVYLTNIFLLCVLRLVWKIGKLSGFTSYCSIRRTN